MGKDQKQHLEVARDIAIKINNHFGELFVVPEAEIDEEVATVPGLDGQKMSKSYGNTIDLFLEENALRKQVMRIVTDPTPVEEPKDPDKCNVFQIYRLFLDKNEEAALRRRYLDGGLGYGEVKQELFVRIRDFFAPFTERRREWLGRSGAHPRRPGQGRRQGPAGRRPDDAQGTQEGGSGLLIRRGLRAERFTGFPPG